LCVGGGGEWLAMCRWVAPGCLQGLFLPPRPPAKGPFAPEGSEGAAATASPMEKGKYKRNEHNPEPEEISIAVAGRAHRVDGQVGLSVFQGVLDWRRRWVRIPIHRTRHPCQLLVHHRATGSQGVHQCTRTTSCTFAACGCSYSACI
jgi:hypothetical protein